jgi:N-methylhydantoinase A
VSLEADLRAEGFDGTLLLMKSDGGLGSIDGAVRSAAQTIYSGPVAGVTCARAMAGDLHEPNLITFDMGGTSTDVGLVHDGRVRMTALQFLDRQALATPMIDITTVGAGGGSVGWRGPEGSLRVGPQSTGADPGPACYQRGGELATVTDANLVLGLIDPDFFLGGEMRLDRDAAVHALTGLGDELGLGVEETAIGIFRVANSVMADAIRLRTVFAGLDPRSFTLVSFGGAGGLHAASIAEELGIERVLVPRLASVFSASGLITTDIVYTFARSMNETIEPAGAVGAGQLESLNQAFAELDAEVEQALDVLNIPGDRREVVHEVGLSYRRQILDFDVQVPPGRLSARHIETATRVFDERYASIYGVGAAAPENGYDMKAFRVTGIGRLRTGVASHGDAAPPSLAEPLGSRSALPAATVDELVELDLYRGERLPAGAYLTGPAIVEYVDTTLMVPRGWTARVNGSSDLLLTRE